MADDVIEQTELYRRALTVAFETRKTEEKRTVLTFPASSDTPIERWYGMEVLSHEKGAVKMTRAKDGAMPLLFNHNIDDPIGMIEDARIREGRMYVDAVLFETARAAEVRTMIDGGLRNVSLAYRVNTLEENKKTGTFTAIDWEPYEVSIVTVPADPSVGIGRGGTYALRMIRSSSPADTAANHREANMAEKETTVAENPAEKKTDESVKITSPAQMEQNRKKAIENICKANRLDDTYRDMWIGKGSSLDQVADELLDILEERGKTNPTSVTKLGLGTKETEAFSIRRAVLACATQSWAKTAPFELECVQEINKQRGLAPDPNKFHIPFEVLRRPVEVPLGKRDITAAAQTQLIQTTNVGFIEMLRNRSVLMRMGARNLSGLVGNVAIPRHSTTGTHTWLANEASTISEVNQGFVQVTLTPRNVGAYTEISRQLLLQSDPSAEGIVTSDLSQLVALAADQAGITGTGANGQPTGLANTVGVNFIITAASASYAGVLQHQVNLASWNVMPAAGGYVTSPEMSSVYMQRQRFTSTDTPLWEGNLWDGRVSGFPAMSTRQVASANCMIFGDWSELIIAEWGVLEIEVNPYAGFTAGIVGVRAIYSLDIGIRRPFAFSVQVNVN